MKIEQLNCVLDRKCQKESMIQEPIRSTTRAVTLSRFPSESSVVCKLLFLHQVFFFLFSFHRGVHRRNSQTFMNIYIKRQVPVIIILFVWAYQAKHLFFFSFFIIRLWSNAYI